MREHSATAIKADRQKSIDTVNAVYVLKRINFPSASLLDVYGFRAYGADSSANNRFSKKQLGGFMQFVIVEKNNHLALHGIFDSRERADRHLTVVIPGYVSKSYFMDKTLTSDNFEVIERK
jgi:hypothetical protein